MATIEDKDGKIVATMDKEKMRTWLGYFGDNWPTLALIVGSAVAGNIDRVGASLGDVFPMVFTVKCDCCADMSPSATPQPPVTTTVISAADPAVPPIPSIQQLVNEQPHYLKIERVKK